MKRMKSVGVFAAAIAGMMLLTGCQATLNATKGTAYTVGGTAVGAAQDAGTAYGAIMATDAWIKDNLW